MIEFSWGHILVIAVVALIVIGPKELPTVLRTAGQWMGKIRRMAAEFQGQFQEALREAEMADLKQQFDDISTAAKDFRHFDPIGTVRKEIEGAIADKPSPKVETASSAVDAPPAAISGPAAQSQAEPADNPAQAPEVQAPEVQAPEAKAPEAKAPEAKAPEAEALEEERDGAHDKPEGRLS
jgi:sec-independent protein translocase protein TatB